MRKSNAYRGRLTTALQPAPKSPNFGFTRLGSPATEARYLADPTTPPSSSDPWPRGRESRNDRHHDLRSQFVFVPAEKPSPNSCGMGSNFRTLRSTRSTPTSSFRLACSARYPKVRRFHPSARKTPFALVRSPVAFGAGTPSRLRYSLDPSSTASR